MKKVLGISIGGTKSAVCLASLSDQLKIEIKKEIKTNPDNADETFANLCKVIDSLGEDFTEISVICGGPLDSKKGVILKPSNLPGFDKFPIVKLLKNKYKVKVSLLNDADACAVAEHRFGSGKGYSNFIFITFGTGLGSGIIINNKLFSGINDGAGEIGHVRISRGGTKARNGKKGSAESLASGGAIQDYALKVFEQKLSAKEVYEMARNGNAKAIKIIDKVAKSLGESISILIDLFNPECIAIGGMFPRALDLLEEKVIKQAKKSSLKLNFKNCKIVPSLLKEEIDDYSSLMGLEEFL